MRTRKTDSRPTVSLRPQDVQRLQKKESPKTPENPDAFKNGEGVIKSVAVKTVAPTKVPHAWAAQLEETAKKTSAELKTAGTLLHEAGDAVEITDPVGLEAHAIGTDCSNLGAHIDSIAKAPHVPAGTVRADIDHLERRAEGLVEKAQGKNIARRALDKISDGAQAIGRALKTYTHGVAKAVDYEQNIDALGEGDRYTLAVEAFLMALGATVEGTTNIDVKKTKDRYVVSMGGELGAGVFAGFGLNVFGAGLDAFASATAGRGTKYELSFATADEAKQAVGLMLSRAGKKVTGRELSADEAELFTKNLSAVDLSGYAGVTGWAMLGLPSVWAAIGEAHARGDHTVRLELGDRPALVLTEQLVSDLEVSLNAATKGAVLAPLALAGGKGAATIVLERRIELDRKPDLTDPVRTLKELKKDVDRSRAKHTVTVSYQGKGGALGSGGGFGLDLALHTDVEALKQSGAIPRALKGDLEGALDVLPSSTELEGTFERFANYGVDIGPAVYFMTFGAGIGLSALRKDVDFEHRKHAKAPVKDTFGAVKKWLNEVATAEA